MANHGLEVGAIVDLDIGGGGSAGGRELDRSAGADICEETALVPCRLPLGITSSVNVVDGTERQGEFLHTPHPRCSAT